MWSWLKRSTGELATSWKRGEPKSHYFDCDCDNNLKCYACSICLVTAKDNLPIETEKCEVRKCEDCDIPYGVTECKVIRAHEREACVRG